MTQTTNKPAHTIRYGTVAVAIWRHTNAKGVNHSVSVERRYFADGKWRNATGFFREDLLTLAKALAEAHSWIYSQPSTATEPATEEAVA